MKINLFSLRERKENIKNWPKNEDIQIVRRFYREFFEAVRRGEEEPIVKLLERGIDINTKDENGWSALMYSIYYEHKKITKLLIENKANVNEKNVIGWTPLMLAAWYGDKETVKLLIEAGADVNERDNFGNTALSYAIERKKDEIINLLRENGAKL